MTLLCSVILLNFTLQDNFGEVVTRDHTDFLIKNREHLLKADQPSKVRFVVKYEGSTAPKFTGFRLNARTQCPVHGG